MEIKLQNSDKVAVVDDDKYELASSEKWFYNHGYIMNNQGKTLHIFLFGKAPTGFTWDHIDRDCLNNKRENLRLATQSQNSANQSKRGGIHSSHFKGVTWFKPTKKWRASIKVNYKKIHLGYFHDEIEAAKAYDKAALEHFGEFAVLNFP